MRNSVVKINNPVINLKEQCAVNLEANPLELDKKISNKDLFMLLQYFASFLKKINR